MPRDNDRELREALDSMANALQTAVLLAEHVHDVSAAAAQDSRTLIGDLRRATVALEDARHAVKRHRR